MKKSITLTAENDLLAYTGKRLQVRHVDEYFARKLARNRAGATQRPVCRVTSGGDVKNAYGWPAYSEGIITVAFPCGSIAQWGCRVSANKITSAGIAEACLGLRARPLFDRRFGDCATECARAWVIGHAAGTIFAAKEKRGY